MRWNSPGRAVIYACTTYAGAMLDKLMHTGRQIPKHQVCVTFDFPDNLNQTPLDENRSDRLAKRRPAGEPPGRRRVACSGPGRDTVVFDVERNALINPAHPDAARIRTLSIESVRWDDRLFSV